MADSNYFEQQGWIKVGDGYVPPGHPLAQQQQAQQAQQPQTTYNAPQLAPPGAGTVQQQSANAQTYSTTPGAAPLANTTNQGSQDVVRNSYLQRATQGTQIDRNDPNLRQQVEPYAAAQERARRDYVSQQAERLSAQGLGNSGRLQNEQRLAAERAGQSTGLFESQLVTRELENRRDEIKDALTNLRGLISTDQAAALQRELANLEATIKRESLSQTGSLGQGDLALRDKLGTGALNVDLMRLLLDREKFGIDAGIRIGDLEGRYAPWLF